MHRFQTVISILCVRLLIAPAFAQQAHQIGEPGGTFAWITGRYRMQQVPPIDLANSGRLELLLRAGRLYLSRQDAIALALENNLDIEIQRYGPQIADAQVLRARAGAFAQGVSTSVTAGPTSAQPGGVAQSGVSGNPSTQASAASATAVGNTVIAQSGPAIPSFDPDCHGGRQHRDRAIRSGDSQLRSGSGGQCKLGSPDDSRKQRVHCRRR